MASATEATLEGAELKRVLATAADDVDLAFDGSELGSRAGAVGPDGAHIDALATSSTPRTSA